MGIRLGVVIKVEVKGGCIGIWIGLVRFVICCFFCERVVFKVLILLVKVVRLGFIIIKISYLYVYIV